MNKKQKEHKEALEYFKYLGIKPGDIVHCILRSVSQSGMNRKISLIYKDRNISFYASSLIGYGLTEKLGHQCLNVSGCGMDMGFQCVYSLGRALFPNGFIPAENSGTNAKPTELDTNGDYALTAVWL